MLLKSLEGESHWDLFDDTFGLDIAYWDSTCVDWCSAKGRRRNTSESHLL